MGTTSSWVIYLCALAASACGTGDNRIDPGDLALRDLLGIAPEAAEAWDPAQRAAAREVLAAGLRADADADAAMLELGAGRTFDERVARALGALDRDRAAEDADALGVVRVTIGGGRLDVAARRSQVVALTARGAAPAVELRLDDAWDASPAWAHLPARGLDALSSIARDAGHTHGPVVVAPWPRLGVIAGYVADARPPRLIVNPVLLAAIEPPAAADAAPAVWHGEPPAASEPTTAARPGAPAHPEPAPGAGTAAGPGNPYSFYGSIAECAAAQRTRCDSCLGTSTCTPITNLGDGNAECTQLAAAEGRGYFLLCINLGLAITSVDLCTKDAAPGCPRDNDAASTLTKLEANANFLDDATCSGGLDGCLAEIYGPPPGDFPGPGPDGGVTPPRPPRSTSVDCGDSCSSSNNNCEASPSCDCSGPSCSNSLSCDSGCSSSNSGGGGCGGGCDSCSDSGGGGGGGGGGGCSSDSSGGGGGCGGGSSGGGCGGGSGGGCGDSGGCGGSSGGGCGDSGGCGGGGGCNSGGGSSCSAARRDPSPGAVWIVSLVWASLPVPVAAMIRRRARKRRDGEPDVPGDGVPDAPGDGEPDAPGDGDGDGGGQPGEEVAR